MGRLQSTTDCVNEQSNFVDLTDDISILSDELDINMDLGNSSQEIHLLTLLIPNDEGSDKNVFIEEETSSSSIKDSFSYKMEEFPFDKGITQVSGSQSSFSFTSLSSSSTSV